MRPNIRRSQIVGFVCFILFALLGLTGPAGTVIVFVGLYVMGTAVYALIRQRSWLGRTTRKTAMGILAGGFVVAIAGGAVAGPPAAVPAAAPSPSVSAASSPSSSPTPRATPSPTPEPTGPTLAEQAALLAAPELAAQVDVASVGATAAPQTALAAAMVLEVKGRAPKTGYDRDLFGSGWVDVDRNGCDTRNDMLARDLTVQTFKPGTNNCVVLTGTLADPYRPTNISFTRGVETSNAVQIDHVVALSDAWQKGAQAWESTRRTGFANDPMNLLAVDGPLNMQKGDGDTATWLPPNKAYRCQYVARQVGVKYTYGLWVTEAERNAMVSVLSTCPAEPLPAGSLVPPAPAPVVVAPAPAPEPAVVAPVPAPAPAPEPVPAPEPAPATSAYYANCAAARAAGAAPVHVGDPGYSTKLDRDRDGVGCE